jgi:hypothetical protein
MALAIAVPRRGSSLELAAEQLEDDAPLFGLVGGWAGHLPAFSNSAPLCTSSVASPPSSRIMFGPEPSGQ